MNVTRKNNKKRSIWGVYEHRDDVIHMMQKFYEQYFIDNLIKVFRRYNKDKLEISINGLVCFANKDCDLVRSLQDNISSYGITVKLDGGSEIVEDIDVQCINRSNGSTFCTKFQIQDIPSIIEQSSKTDIPLVCLIIMKSIALVISKIKVLYKAIILDLDDTLWYGTLSEVGIEKIKEDMKSDRGVPFISFMKFIKLLAEELGVFLAICSKNEHENVVNAIESLDNEIFPIKNYIDFIIANDNDKSENIALITNKLSILPDSVIFIDDNPIVRDQVRCNMPEIFVPEWRNHYELITILTTGCCFERNKLSIKAQTRKKQYQMILAERNNNSLPSLSIKVIKDTNHINASDLYSKSNQFNFSQLNRNFEGCALSTCFEIFRKDGKSLGICSAITYVMSSKTLTLLNWAMSCRFFEIGVEETVLLYLEEIAESRKISIQFNDSGYNKKAKELIDKYPNIFMGDSSLGLKEIALTEEMKKILCNNTNLNIIQNG